jgi:hypothetical protein
MHEKKGKKERGSTKYFPSDKRFPKLFSKVPESPHEPRFTPWSDRTLQNPCRITMPVSDDHAGGILFCFPGPTMVEEARAFQTPWLFTPFRLLAGLLAG